MSCPIRSPTSSSSTLIVSPLPLDHHINSIPSKKPVLKLLTTPYSSWSFPGLEVDKRMSGKGFIEPHRNNLPRRTRKQRVVTATPDVHEIDKTSSQTLLPTSEAGPRSSIQDSIRLTSAALPQRYRSRSEFGLTTKDVSGHQPRADSDLVAILRKRQFICAQELSKGVILGFLAEGDEYVRIKVYDDSTPLSLSPPPTSSVPYLQLPLPANPLSYTDGTTSLTDTQIQQACTFIDEHALRPGHVSVLILAPRTRPEEAMSIGVSYLAGIQNTDRGIEEMEGDNASDDDVNHFSDYTYSTIHQLLMAFHDDPGSSILETKGLEAPGGYLKPDTSEDSTSNLTPSGCGIDANSLRGLRPEWRGVLSFDGMQRLDKVWTRRR